METEISSSLTVADWEFVKALALRFSVRVLSHQVCITTESKQTHGEPLAFPSNWELQWIGILPSKYEDSHRVQMTWRINSTPR